MTCAQVLVCLLSVLLAGCQNSNHRAPVAERSVGAKRDQPPAWYTVRKGDTLYSISWRYGLDFRTLARINNVDNQYRIFPGQRLRLQQTASVNTASPHVSDQKIVNSSSQSVPARVKQESVALVSAPSVSPVSAAPVVAVVPVKIDSASVTTVTSAATEAKMRNAPVVRAETSDVRTIGSAPAGSKNTQVVRTGVVSQSGNSKVTGPGGSISKSSVDADGKRNQTATQAPKVSKQPAIAESPKPGSYSVQKKSVKVGNVLWQWPADGRVIESFKTRGRVNKGINISGRLGDPVYASASGEVVYAGSGLLGYGNLIIVNHNGLYMSAYAHNSRIFVKERDRVRRGDRIAEMGNSGADRHMLHFEIRRDGKPVNPMKYLPKR
ncbi:MAG: peptidoglycan DD-metalloendopeptidase family protein [Marinobacterium sp.]|nr:peptidoglycan DD-metalloendopeptidase family protein [Marinobacterium sp.]